MHCFRLSTAHGLLPTADCFIFAPHFLSCVGTVKAQETVPFGAWYSYLTVVCPANAGAAGGDMKEQIKTGRRRKYKSLICKV